MLYLNLIYFLYTKNQRRSQNETRKYADLAYINQQYDIILYDNIKIQNTAITILLIVFFITLLITKYKIIKSRASLCNSCTVASNHVTDGTQSVLYHRIVYQSFMRVCAARACTQSVICPSHCVQVLRYIYLYYTQALDQIVSLNQ